MLLNNTVTFPRQPLDLSRVSQHGSYVHSGDNAVEEQLVVALESG